MRVLHRRVELTGYKQAGSLDAGKIDRSAEALQKFHLTLKNHTLRL
jgi:hypothetical protein